MAVPKLVSDRMAADGAVCGVPTALGMALSWLSIVNHGWLKRWQ